MNAAMRLHRNSASQPCRMRKAALKTLGRAWGHSLCFACQPRLMSHSPSERVVVLEA